MLEDEFGDIVRKARTGQGVSQQQLADAAGLTPAEIKSIENYELAPGGEAVARIAQRLSLKPDALEAMARASYEPAPVDVEGLGCLAVIPSPYRDMVVNTYVVWDNETRQAVLFDTGTDFEAIKSVVDGNGLKVELLAMTHTHGDHVAVMDEVRQAFAPKVACSQSEPVTGGEIVTEGQVLSVGAVKVEVRETPGHSPGGLTFVVDVPGCPLFAVVGDAIFAGSAGGAAVSYPLLMDGVRNKILTLPDDTIILPGHGPLTTVGSERRSNPFAL